MGPFTLITPSLSAATFNMRAGFPLGGTIGGWLSALSASTFHVVVKDTGKTQIVCAVFRAHEQGVVANTGAVVAILLLLSFCVPIEHVDSRLAGLDRRF
jgi:hypothetical protein